MQAGRAAKAAARSSAADQQRSAYTAWVKADAEQFRRYRAGDITYEQWRMWARSHPMPELYSSKEEA
jgi:hypothetical protein